MRVVRLALVAMGAATGAAAAAAPLPVVWEHRTAAFAYIGVTVPYACVSLESQVRRILAYFGARDDMKVAAAGCPGGPAVPSQRAWVTVDFYAPAPAPAPTASSLKAQWRRLNLTSRHPKFMSRADCDLLQGMKGVVTASFTLRGLDYAATCFPGDSSDDAFAVRGEALDVLR